MSEYTLKTMESSQRAGIARAGGLVEGFGTGSVRNTISYDTIHADADSNGPAQDLPGAARSSHSSGYSSLSLGCNTVV